MPIDAVFQTFPRLETERLLLRRLAESDANALYHILADDSVTQFYDDDSFTSISQASEQIEAWERGYQNRFCVRWGLAQRGENTIIGTCGFYGFHSWHRRAGIGFELTRRHWRQGLMTEALSAILDYGFYELELNRIEAVVMPGNSASVELLEKLGFRNEGLLREYERWGSKGLVDLCMFAVLRSESQKQIKLPLCV